MGVWMLKRLQVNLEEKTNSAGPWKEEPVLYLKMHVALLHLHDGREAEARVMVVDEGKACLDALPAPDPSVSAAFYYVCSQYHKAKQDFAAGPARRTTLVWLFSPQPNFSLTQKAIFEL